MVKEENLNFNEMMNPDNLPSEVVSYLKALSILHMRIEKFAPEALSGANPQEQRSNLNKLYGAVYTMITNLYDDATKEYKEKADKYMKLDLADYNMEDAFIDFWRQIMLMHKLNRQQYKKHGLISARAVSTYIAPEETNKENKTSD